MDLLKIADAPAVRLPPTATVMEAIKAMGSAGVGALVVVDGEALQGIFTERDVMLRVVLKGRDPAATQVSEVMTYPVVTIPTEMKADEVEQMMWTRHIRHLPVVDAQGRVQAIVSIRHLLHQKVDRLTEELESLERYFTADGL